MSVDVFLLEKCGKLGKKGPFSNVIGGENRFVDFHFLSCFKIWGTRINVFMSCADMGKHIYSCILLFADNVFVSIALHGEIDVSTCQWQGTLLSSNRDERIDVCDFCKRGKVFFGMDGRLGRENWIEMLVHSGK